MAKTELEKLVSLCMDAEGYVLFIGVLTPSKEGKGTDVIWNFRRYHIGIEDVIEAGKEFQKFIEAEKKKLE